MISITHLRKTRTKTHCEMCIFDVREQDVIECLVLRFPCAFFSLDFYLVMDVSYQYTSPPVKDPPSGSLAFE